MLDRSKGWSAVLTFGGETGWSFSSSEADREHIDLESEWGEGEDLSLELLAPKSSLMIPPMRGRRPAAIRAAALTGGKLLFKNGKPCCPVGRLEPPLFMKNGRWAARAAAAALGTPDKSW